ncbi:glutathione S-transferase family protein [Aquabacterium sp. NJ1]|uniref:glutathione S-transferase family protein n=1 Tax=Aquabacterium sp. NJ1 TaxID=1538295 RepID=UPI0009E067BB|nr:glutathione S-transferase family protein [Aquabacterium sp. NJ1]
MATLAKAPARTPAKKAAAKKAVARKAPIKAVAPAAVKALPDTTTTLTITSKNYSSWSLRGWLLARFAGLPFVEHVLPPEDPSTRAEILLLSSSILVPCLEHQGIRVWDTLAIAEYLNEVCPEAHLLPADAKARAHCRAISGEMHSGFSALRSSLPMNLRNHFPKFKIWSRAQADIDRITAIWRDCISTYGGPYLFGAQRTVADAMYAPVCTRFATYDVKLDAVCQAYCDLMLSQPEMKEWLKGAKAEPADIDELDVEF